MNTILAIFIAALCFNGAFAMPLESNEERTILNTDSGMYLGLNTTTLVIGLVVIAALAVGVIALSGSGLLDEVSGQQQQRYDQEQYYHGEEHPYRAKRSFNESKSFSFEQLINPLHPITSFF